MVPFKTAMDGVLAFAARDVLLCPVSSLPKVMVNHLRTASKQSCSLPTFISPGSKTTTDRGMPCCSCTKRTYLVPPMMTGSGVSRLQSSSRV